MALDPIGELLRRIRRGGAWPPKSEKAAWDTVARGRAFAESNRTELARIARWRGDRPYRVDPLPDRIREAWADHAFGEDLTVEPAGEVRPAEDGTARDHPDAARLDLIVAENDLTEEVRHAVRDYQVPEGEAWWRILRDVDVADVPLLEWHSRGSVAPFYIGRRLMAAALITVLEGPANVTASDQTVWRLFECHENERMVMVLFRGSRSRIGTPRPLDEHAETEELDDLLEPAVGDVDVAGQWAHGLPMLMGRVPNKRGRDPRLGISEYAPVEDLLLKLNEAVTIGWENLRLTAKRRVVVSSSAVQAGAGNGRPTGDQLIDAGDGSFVRADGRPQFDAGEDVLIADPIDEELGKDPAAVFKVLEYSYDAEPLIADKRDTVETVLTRLGLTPQWVGVVTNSSDGFATSGTALRLRLIPTDKAGRGRGRAWDRELPRILRIMAMLDALPEAEGGLGAQWSDPEAEPIVTRANPLPVDEVEQATTESTLVTAGARSVETSVRAQHPTWDDDQVRDELDRIRDDRASSVPGAGF